MCESLFLLFLPLSVDTDIQLAGNTYYAQTGQNGHSEYYSNYYYIKPTVDLTVEEMRWVCDVTGYIPSDQSLVLTIEMRTTLFIYWSNYTGLGNENSPPDQQLCSDTNQYLGLLISTCRVQPYNGYPTLATFFNNETFSVLNQTLKDITAKRLENLIERTKTETNVTIKLFSLFQKQPIVPVEWPPLSIEYPAQLYFTFPF